jgi:hypothetical protein
LALVPYKALLPVTAGILGLTELLPALLLFGRKADKRVLAVVGQQ